MQLRGFQPTWNTNRNLKSSSWILGILCEGYFPEDFELENNESAVGLNLLSFSGHEGELILIIGTVKDLIFQPKSFSACFLYAFSFMENGTRLQLLHKTAVEDIPYCMTAFKGKLLAGIGNKLRLYDLGMKKMLKKAELKGFSTGINTIQTHGERILWVIWLILFMCWSWDQSCKLSIEFADDILPRWISAACVLDHRTMGQIWKRVHVHITI